MADLNQRLSACTAIDRLAAEILKEDFQGDLFFCQQRLATLEKHFDRFIIPHDKLVGAASDEAELRSHMDLWDKLEGIYSTAVIKLNRMISQLDLAPNPLATGANSLADDTESQRAAILDLKLVPVGVPKFDGSLRNWLSFKDAIQTILDKPNIPEYYKLTKLRDSMASESLKTLVGNLYTGGFQATWDELLRRFDNPKQLAELHVSRFVGIRPVSSETSADLLTIVDTVRESLRALRVMDLPVDQWDALSVPIVTSKLPQTTQHAWGMHTDQKKIPTLDELLTFVERRAQSLSLDVLRWPGTSDKNTLMRRGLPQSPINTPKKLVKSNLAATAPGNCEYCNNPSHQIYRCPKLLAVPVAERFSKLSGSNLCFNCLKPGHSTKTCSGGNCRRCQGKHNSLLCRSSAATTSAPLASTSTTNSASTSSSTQSANTTNSQGGPSNFA